MLWIASCSRCRLAICSRHFNPIVNDDSPTSCALSSHRACPNCYKTKVTLMHYVCNCTSTITQKLTIYTILFHRFIQLEDIHRFRAHRCGLRQFHTGRHQHHGQRQRLSTQTGDATYHIRHPFLIWYEILSSARFAANWHTDHVAENKRR